jgi:hypothetical protein
MMNWPAVVVHGLDHAKAALRPGWPVILQSAEAAAGYAGALWWRELVAAARAAHPATPAADVLDCGAAPGYAMAALRAGQRVLVLDPACPAFAAVTGAAGTLGAVVLAHRLPALDLDHRGAARRLARWLAMR